MLPGPVQASFPSLGAFPREAGTSGHVYPLSTRSPSPMTLPTDSLRLSTSIASATFWRSPYSEALRVSRSSMPTRAERHVAARDVRRSMSLDAQPEKSRPEEKESTCEPAVAVEKSVVEGKDSGSDTSGDQAQQLRGILCKSSLSSSSRQSGAKVQKRVKFEDCLDKGQSPRQSVSAVCGRPPKHDGHQCLHRSMSASAPSKFTVRMPSIQHQGERQQADKSCWQTKNSSYASSPSHSPASLPNPHQTPHIPKHGSGPMIRSSSVPELTLPRPSPKNYQNSYQHSLPSPHSIPGSISTGPGSTSSRLSPTAHDFKIYRHPVVKLGPSTRVSESGQSCSPPPHSRGRFFATHGHSTGTRSLVRLSRSFTAPSISLHQPVKRPIPSSSSNEDPALTPPASREGTTPQNSEKASTACDVSNVSQVSKKEEERRESFLDTDKAVQILHWLEEVDHRQAKEGRCPVFVSATSRDT